MGSPSITRSSAFLLFYDDEAIKDEDILTSMSENLNSFKADQFHKSLKKKVLFKIIMFSKEL